MAEDSGITSTAPIDDTPATPAKPADGGTPATPADQAPAPNGDTPTAAKTGDTPEKGETPRWLQKQIDKATKRFYEQKARADFLAEENARLRPKPAATEGAPTLEQFNFDQAAHAEASAKYFGDKAARDLEQRNRTQAQTQAVSRIVGDWEKKSDKGSEKYADFDQVVGDMQPVSDLHAAVMECENAEDVAYYLGKNPAEAIRIAALDVRSQVRAIGKLEAKLAAEPPKIQTPPSAPAPIKPVGGASSPSTKKLSEMSQDEFEKRRKQQIAQRR